MSKPRTYQTEAIIIKKTKLGEADRIITLYTPTLGKIQGFAKAVRKPKSKLCGHLEIMTHSYVTLARGKNIDTIIGSQTQNAFPAIKNSLDLLSIGLYMTELISQFTPAEHEDEGVFELFLHSLERLSTSIDFGLLLRFFELHLLQQAGYRPELEKCVQCNTIPASGVHSFSPAAGGTLCKLCQKTGRYFSTAISWDALCTMRFIQEGDWNCVSNTPLDKSVLSEIELPLRNYIRHILEKDIKSLKWLSILGSIPI